jgi:hypothetical protein
MTEQAGGSTGGSALKDLVFMLCGRLSKSRAVLEKLITDNGGQLCVKASDANFAIIGSRPGKKLKECRDAKKQCLKETFLFRSIEEGRLLDPSDFLVENGTDEQKEHPIVHPIAVDDARESATLIKEPLERDRQQDEPIRIDVDVEERKTVPALPTHALNLPTHHPIFNARPFLLDRQLEELVKVVTEAPFSITGKNAKVLGRGVSGKVVRVRLSNHQRKELESDFHPKSQYIVVKVIRYPIPGSLKYVRVMFSPNFIFLAHRFF